jgi:hypothetical protein
MISVTLRKRTYTYSRDKPSSVAGKFGLSLFFLFFLAMGSLFEVFIVRQFSRALSQHFWKEVACEVVASDVQERSDRELPYAFTVRYRYEYAGPSYTSTRYKRNDAGFDSYSKAQQLAQKYPSGGRTFCYVNPRNASEAVLRRDSPLIGLAVFFPLIFVLIGAGGIYFLWRRPPQSMGKPIVTPAVRKGTRSRYAASIVFFVCALFGGALLYPLGIKPIARTIDANSWAATPCKVLRAEVRRHDSDEGTTYSAYILYQYKFGGRTYKSDRLDFIGGSSSGYQGKARLVALYEAAANPICYVNPRNPSEAVLKRGFHAKLLLALFPLPFLLIGVGGVFYTLRGKRPAVTGPTLTGSATRRAGPTRSTAPADTGRVVLAPKYSPRAKFAGILFFALVWNGIVLAVGRGALGGLGMLFVAPFALIGLGLLGGAGYLFLAMFNPRPTLELSSRVIPLGGATELRWSFTGQTSRIRELTVTLRGAEEAQYQRGTSTYTDRNVFYEMELYKTCDANQIVMGQVGLVMPQDTMHSFEAANNKILWDLDVHGAIKGWPDVKESFRITVTPTTA